jgi:hypothetical protein
MVLHVDPLTVYCLKKASFLFRCSNKEKFQEAGGAPSPSPPPLITLIFDVSSFAFFLFFFNSNI